MKNNSAADKSSTALHCDYLNRLKPLSRWKKCRIQLEQVSLDTEPRISLAVGAEQIGSPHCPAHSWAPPAAQGLRPLSAAGKHWPKCHPALGSIQHVVQSVQGSAFRTARQLLWRFLKISSEKQTGFVPFHPVYTHKKISTLYKEQQRYNLNMHPATNHIYRETGLYKQNRSTLLHQNSGGVSGGNDGR